MRCADDESWRQALRRLRDHLFDRDVAPLAPEIRAYCRQLTRSSTTADDLAQEVLVRGLHAVGRLCPGIRDPRAYLYRVATNLWIDATRRRRTLVFRADVVEAAPSRGAALPRLELGDAAATIDAVLPPTERAAFVARTIEGLTHREIADRLGKTEAAIKMATSRARRRLAAALDPDP